MRDMIKVACQSGAGVIVMACVSVVGGCANPAFASWPLLLFPPSLPRPVLTFLARNASLGLRG